MVGKWPSRAALHSGRPRGVMRENSRFCARFTTSDRRTESPRSKGAEGPECVCVKDAKIYRNNNTPWRVKCSRMTDKVYGVFVHGGKNGAEPVWTKSKDGKRNY